MEKFGGGGGGGAGARLRAKSKYAGDGYAHTLGKKSKYELNGGFSCIF